ncbi:MFS transporter [Microbulbifer sp. HZ11]|uniref:MFS transporter n=1 Tax=unclassified Microbulbifer TaxID=2619833 RepID=UPI0009DD92C5|nr:MFS transporter [Microbulbifer sp. HZ11]
MAACLRAPVTGVGPLVGTLQSDLGLEASTAGLLTTLPLLMFSAGSLFAASLARRWGLTVTIFIALVGIFAGILLRSMGSTSTLFAGTAVIGAGIALGNVLLPSLVKADFPESVAQATSVSGVSMGTAGALVSVCVVPLALWLGWQGGLVAVALLPLLAIVVWAVRVRRVGWGSGAAAAAQSSPMIGRASKPLWRSSIAWQITLFLGFNSVMFYSMASWLPAILTDAGFSAVVAGSLHGEMQLASALPGLFLGPVIARFGDQRLMAVGMALLMTVALFGLLYQPGVAVLWVALFGFGSSGCFLLAIMFMAFRTHSAGQAASLSGMAQFLGYLVAACGPTLSGAMKEQWQSWQAPLVVGVCLTLVMAICGALAGRNRKIQ